MNDLYPILGDLLDCEDERREWKESGADIDDIVATLCAFANDWAGTGGGAVLCGIRESKNDQGHKIAEIVGLERSVYQKLARSVQQKCHRQIDPPVTIKMDSYDISETGRKVLVFSINASHTAHMVKIKKMNRYYPIRIGENTTRANGLTPALLERKGLAPPFLERLQPDAAVRDLDQDLLRQYLDKLSAPQPLSHYLRADQRLPFEIPSLLSRSPTNSEDVHPRKYALLIFNKTPRQFIPGAFVSMAVYRGTDKTAPTSLNLDIDGPLVSVFEEVKRKLETQMGFTTVSDVKGTGQNPNQPRYARQAVYETVANALIHRDYANPEPVRIDIYADRMEIINPGGLPDQITRDSFLEGKASPQWRNHQIAQLMIELGVAQRRGQGIQTIISSTQDVSGKKPEFLLEPGRVAVTLPAARPNILLMPPVVNGQSNGRNPGIAIVAFGTPSIDQQVTESLAELGLADIPIVLSFAEERFIESGSDEWNDRIEVLKQKIRATVANPKLRELHLFYRGPVTIAMMLGALVGPNRKTYLYNYNPDTGSYRFDLLLDVHFLKA